MLNETTRETKRNCWHMWMDSNGFAAIWKALRSNFLRINRSWATYSQRQISTVEKRGGWQLLIVSYIRWKHDGLEIHVLGDTLWRNPHAPAVKNVTLYTLYDEDIFRDAKIGDYCNSQQFGPIFNPPKGSVSADQKSKGRFSLLLPHFEINREAPFFKGIVCVGTRGVNAICMSSGSR